MFRDAFKNLGVFVLLSVTMYFFMSCNATNPEKQSKVEAGNIQQPTDEILFVTGEWMPYTSESMEEKGVSTEVLRAIIKEMGIKANIEFYPWKRCQEKVLHDESWATYPGYYTEERAKSFNYSKPFMYCTTKYFYYEGHKIKGNITFKDLSELKFYTFGRIGGYYYENIMEDLKLKTELANSVESLLKMLQNGRIDIMIEDELVVKSEIKRLFPDEMDKFKTFEQIWGRDGLYLMISKTYPKTDELTKKFNEGIEKIKKNGEYQRIFSKYGIIDTDIP